MTGTRAVPTGTVPLASPSEQPPSLPHFSRNFLTPPVSGAAPAGYELPVTLDVVVLHVVEKAAAAPDEHHEASPGMMVVLVDLQVLGQVSDSFAQQSDLDLGRARVRLVKAVSLDGR